MDGHTPRTPRRKTPIACQFCRLKKIKCDGLRPICGACSRKGWGTERCTYKQIDRKAESVSERLQQRIESLEKSQIQQPPPPLDHPAPPSRQIQDTDDVGPLLSITGSPAINGEVNALTSAATGEHQSEGFHGTSSAASFLDTVRHAIEGQTSPDYVAGIVSPIRSGAVPTAGRLEYVLPPRKLSDDLQEDYWTFVHPLYPFIDRRTFDQIYGLLWTGTPLSSNSTHIMRLDEAAAVAILNLVLALGCQYRNQTEPGDAHIQAEVFYNRAHTLFTFDPTDTSLLTLQVLQVMLLMAQYLTGTGRTHKAWGIIGMALRGCHHLGLHRALLYDKNGLDVQYKTRKKMLYQGCVMLERMICMNLGRPAMVNATARASLPSEKDYGDPSAVDTVDATNGSVLTFFVASTKLYQIAQQILLSFYSDEITGYTGGYEPYFEGKASVFQFERELQRWCDDVPARLMFRSGTVPGQAQNDLQMTFRRQAVVLRLRYLQVRIYLFRPVFARFCISQYLPEVPIDEVRRPCGDDLNNRVALQCCILCVKAARELIEIMHDNLTSARSWGRKPAWLYGVLHIYLSATVLLAARLRPVVTLGSISDAELQVSWQRAMQILGSFQNDSTSAKRCVTALRTLYEKLSLPGDAQIPDEAQSNSAERNAPVMESVDQGLLQGYGTVTEVFADPAAMSSNEMGQVFGWPESFDDFDATDLSWLNVVPGDLLA